MIQYLRVLLGCNHCPDGLSITISSAYPLKPRRAIYGKIVSLIDDILRNPFDGLGKPEPLKYELKGYWSRRISDEHRLVYKINDDSVIIVSCKFHYEK